MAITSDEILSLPMDENDAGAKTVRGYLYALLIELWEKEEGFSGKRPFGNSGWQWDVYKALLKGGAVPGKLGAEGDVLELDSSLAHEIVIQAIEHMTR